MERVKKKTSTKLADSQSKRPVTTYACLWSQADENQSGQQDRGQGTDRQTAKEHLGTSAEVAIIDFAGKFSQTISQYYSIYVTLPLIYSGRILWFQWRPEARYRLLILLALLRPTLEAQGFDRIPKHPFGLFSCRVSELWEPRTRWLHRDNSFGSGK